MGANFCFRPCNCTPEVRSPSSHENLFVSNNLELRRRRSFLGVLLIVSLNSSGFEYLRAASANTYGEVKFSLAIAKAFICLANLA